MNGERRRHDITRLEGFIALAMALWAPLMLAPFSPASLCLIGPGHYLWGMRNSRIRTALEKRLAPAAVS